jgi:hypothetical protein
MSAKKILIILPKIWINITDMIDKMNEKAGITQTTLVFFISKTVHKFFVESQINLPWKIILSDDEDLIIQHILDYSKIFILSPTFTLIKDILALSDDNPFVNVILQAILGGVPVFMQELPSKNNKIKDILKEISDFGIQLIPILNIFEKSNCWKKDLLTERDILQVADREIIVPENTIITPLALDKAKELNIKIIRVIR